MTRTVILIFPYNIKTRLKAAFFVANELFQIDNDKFGTVEKP